MEFVYLVFTHMPGESYRRWLGSLLLCDVFWALLNSLVCWFCRSTMGLIAFQTCANTYSTPFAHLNTTTLPVTMCLLCNEVCIMAHHAHSNTYQCASCAIKDASRLTMRIQTLATAHHAHSNTLLPSYMDTYHDPLGIQTCFNSPCVHSNTWMLCSHIPLNYHDPIVQSNLYQCSPCTFKHIPMINSYV